MKKDKINELLNVLKSSTTWISSASLSKMIGVSERTIRNYINEINDTQCDIIESSKYGYRINSENLVESNHTPEEIMDPRSNLVLSKLLSSQDGISVFDIAEELHVSESTVMNNVLPKIKALVKNFNIKVQTHDYQFYLSGKEQDKRKLVGHIATNNVYGYFTSTETLKKLFPSFDIDQVLHELYQICHESDLLLNNYSLNNLLVHILIIIIRLESKNTLNTSDALIDANKLIEHFDQKNDILELANRIAQFFEKTYNSSIPEKDFHQIVILIALSIEHYSFDDLDFNKLSKFIDQRFLDNIMLIAQEMIKRYDIPKIDDDFLLQFTLHMYNVYQRATYHVSYPNPIANQIKKDYAPIYDMAVFFAHKFAVLYDIEINEDEIAFIAFHIGAYLERNKSIKDTVSCIVIVEDYHDFARKLINDLESNFHDEMVILDVMSYNRFVMLKPKSDLLLTTIDISIHHPHKVVINPMLTKQNIFKIWNEIEEIQDIKKQAYAKVFLEQMLYPSLFIRNVSLNSVQEYIEYMGDLCIQQKFIQPDFIKDVLLRESVSSTAFTDCLAIPHAINQYAEHSFICVLHNDMPIPWGRHQVNFVLMIGIAEQDMKYFKDAFDLIIDLYSSVDKTIQILNTDTFNEFKAVFISSKA